MRFWLFAVLGGIFGVILTSISSFIPLLNTLNACCLLNAVGAMGALALYFEFTKDAEPITDMQSLMFGLVAGVISGFTTIAVLVIVIMFFGFIGGLAALEGQLPPELAVGGTMFMVAALVGILVALTVNIVACGMGSWALLNLLFTEHKAG